MKEKVMEMVQQYPRQGIIRKSHSPWASPLVLVRKKDGYWQIRMEADSIEKTAFSSPSGLYEFTVMSFGLTNAVATFQRFIESLFHDMLDQFVFVYIDDILVASESWEEHTEHLRLVLTRISEAGLRLIAKKCQFARQEVPFLGHLLTTDGVCNPDKVAPIRDCPTPNTVTELQRFLGLASYNRKFTFPDYKAAESDEKRRFVIMTDATTDGLGGVFCQPDGNTISARSTSSLADAPRQNGSTRPQI
ncbi:hypothetical protein QR680_017409 [Steinernema hermaphroditum]|uniref:Reverse transcriptase domain-containing protein n=1 Tax=Steinernema hermaphroditum TaxID=289476 RepID=A0AA39LP86_9BILA|nr:hypothetical protein QR680_017409 [Steinernema hermaphroditum]